MKNKVVVITGAAGVICSTIAEHFAKLGSKVAMLDLNYEMAKKYEDDFNSRGLISKAYKCNVLDRENIEKVYESIKKILEKLTY